MINRNLRFILGSDPVSVTTHAGREYLAIRTALSELPGQPREVVQLEFQKAFCLACIGADRPDPLLKAFGADFVPRESGTDDRLVVSPLLETRRPGVFLAGDLLSPDYAESSNFDDPATFAIRPRRGNIKAALRDGVVLAEVVKQRLEGRQDIRVVVTPAADLPASAERAPIRVKSGAPAIVAQPSSPGRLVSLLADGMPADEFPLTANGVTTIGRLGSSVVFPEDTMLSDQHAAVAHGPGGLELRDLGSQHGVFVKVPEGRVVPVSAGMIVKAGRQWLVTRDAGEAREVVHYDPAGREVARYRIAEATTLLLGRTAPSTILDSDDATLSRRHLSISREAKQLLLRDLSSRNGTYLKIDRPWRLSDGDLIWLGNQLLRVAIGTAQLPAAPAVIQGRPTPAPAPASPPVKPAVLPAEPGAAMVTFGSGQTYPFGASATLLDLALSKRVRIKYDCRSGDCGKCRVEVTSGAALLNARQAQEEKTLRMIGHSEPESRLACLVREVRGPVVVEIPN
jgi:pSer/pThr/pTyr-binding forkhead associated (FHA) protein/ferredoxin